VEANLLRAQPAAFPWLVIDGKIKRADAMDSQDVRFYLSIFLRRLHYFLFVAVVVTAAGSLVALILPSVYLAVARIMVESPRISADLARPSVPADAIQELQVLEQQLTTRASLLTMAEKFAIYPAADKSADDIVSDMRARTKVEPVGVDGQNGSSGAIAFAISFEASDPDLAASVANAYATAILDTNARERKMNAAEASKFFSRDVERLKAALAQAQDAILRFKQEHRDALPDSLAFRRIQQQTDAERLQQLQREEVSFQQRRSTIEQILAAPLSGRALTADEQALADLRRVLADQEAIFSENSPNLQALRLRVANLEKQLSGQHADQPDISLRNDLSPDLKVQVADMNAQLAFIAEEKKAVEHRLVDWARSIAETEMNSTMLSALERNYETAQTQYNEAVARLAAASTGQRIEAEAIGEKLTLIEPATPPAKPIWPKRRALAASSLAVGIGLGLGLIVLLEFWTPTVRRPSDLAAVFDGQPLATIPYIWTSGEVQMRRVKAAVVVLALICSVPGFLVVRKHLPPPIGTAISSESSATSTEPSM
jgi:polysaccharide chain length determinant protein (PEP-CTERM system associated)